MSKAIICFSTDNGSGAQTKIQQVDDNHGLPISGSISATTAATATVAAPSYVEGTSNALSMDLAGNLRIGGTISASSSMRSTTADPSYVNGTDNSLSSDLAGYLRSLCKQTGTWTVGLSAGAALIGKVGIDQTTPGTTNAVAVTNAPTAWSVNSGNKDNGTLRVVFATDQPQNTTAFKVDGSAVTQPAKEARSGTGTRTSVAGNAGSVTILASNANRLGASIFNDSTAILYLDLSGGTATTANYTVQLGQNAYYEVPANYTGLITGIWASATGAAKIAEFT